MEYSRESQDRMKKIQALKDAGIIPYANNYRGKQDIDDIIAKKEQVKDADTLMESGAIGDFKTAWRIVSYRSFGKLSFAKLLDHSGAIQVSFTKDMVEFNTGRPSAHPKPLPCKEGGSIVWKDETIVVDKIERSPFKIIEKLVDVWDYIWVIGDLFITKHGELTLFVKEFQILSKAVRPLPEKFHGVTDQETIYRQRYLDLITNEESYERMLFRSKYMQATRDFYLQEWFIEIETPVLWNAASWAAAQPFITRHNDFWEDVVLRIAPEIALKMATVWRYEKVFEFAKNFRNEWSDPSHIQEFSVVEHYAAWWNFEDNIKFTENMMDFIFEKLHLDKKVKIKDKEWIEKMVDFTTPWERIDYTKGVTKASWIDISKYSETDADKLRSDIKAKWHIWEWMEAQATATLIDYLYKKVLRPWIVGPAFIYNYPKLMQPLARQSDENPDLVEQFQVVLNGWEIMKAYSELVDPKVQQENFEAQSWAIEMWDEEATSGDDDFVLAMEYWMPCQSGWAVGFDRIISLLTGQENLRDVVLFPLMKSEKEEKSKKQLEKEYRSKKVMVIADESQPAWVVANAIGQLGIEIGWHSKEKLFEARILIDADDNIHYTDCFYGMSNLAWSREQMAEFVQKCNEAGIQVFDFSDIMRKAHHDEEMLKWYKEKKTADIWYIAVWALIPSDFEKEFLDGLKKFGS